MKELARLRQELIQYKTNEIIRKEGENRKGAETVAMDISHVPSKVLSQHELELEEALQDSEEAVRGGGESSSLFFSSSIINY